jgi:hypothetical protein
MAETLATNKEMLDTVQDSALQLTEMVQQLNNYALLNSSQIVEAVERARVSLAGIPIAERILSIPVFSHTEDLGNQIRLLSDECRVTMSEIADSIRRSDPTKMKSHFVRLRALQARIRDELFSPGAAAMHLTAAPAAVQIAAAAEQTAAMLADMRTVSLTLLDVLENLGFLASNSTSTALAPISQARRVLKHFPGANQLIANQPLTSVEGVGRRLVQTGDKIGSLAQNIRVSLTQPTKDSLQASIEGLEELRMLVPQRS